MASLRFCAKPAATQTSRCPRPRTHPKREPSTRFTMRPTIRHVLSRTTPVCARVGSPPAKDGLLMIQGPTMIDWSRRKRGLVPRLENANLDGRTPPSAARLSCWLRAGIHVTGRPDWIFIKLHTHGAPEHNAAMLLGEPMQRFHASLAQRHREDPSVPILLCNRQGEWPSLYIRPSKEPKPRRSIERSNSPSDGISNPARATDGGRRVSNERGFALPQPFA